MSADQSFAIFHSAVFVPDVEGKTGLVGAGTQYSDVVGLNGGDVGGFHIETTGTLTAALTFWVSGKPNPDVASDADWVQDTSFAITSPAGATTKAYYHLGNNGARFMRFKSVTASGTGNLKGWAVRKGA